MIERPILFSAEMVRALLSGRKTQTRRALRIQPPFGETAHYDKATGGAMWPSDHDGDCGIACPYGMQGGRLWVRENGWQRPERSPRDMREGADTWEPYYFDADITQRDHEAFKVWGFRRRPSIHMPRAFCRLVLEVLAVRVERLQDISEDDACAEGIEAAYPPGMSPATFRFGYAGLWEKINGRGSWARNPFVWAVTFRRLTSAS